MNTPQNIPSHDAISSRARKIWESSGQIDGRDLDNWLQAEKELMDAAGPGSPMDERKKDVLESRPGSAGTQQSAPLTPWPRDRGNQDRIPKSRKQAADRRSG